MAQAGGRASISGKVKAVTEEVTLWVPVEFAAWAREHVAATSLAEAIWMMVVAMRGIIGDRRLA